MNNEKSDRIYNSLNVRRELLMKQKEMLQKELSGVNSELNSLTAQYKNNCKHPFRTDIRFNICGLCK